MVSFRGMVKVRLIPESRGSSFLNETCPMNSIYVVAERLDGLSVARTMDDRTDRRTDAPSGGSE